MLGPRSRSGLPVSPSIASRAAAFFSLSAQSLLRRARGKAAAAAMRVSRHRDLLNPVLTPSRSSSRSRCVASSVRARTRRSRALHTAYFRPLRSLGDRTPAPIRSCRQRARMLTIALRCRAPSRALCRSRPTRSGRAGAARLDPGCAALRTVLDEFSRYHFASTIASRAACTVQFEYPGACRAVVAPISGAALLSWLAGLRRSSSSARVVEPRHGGEIPPIDIGSSSGERRVFVFAGLPTPAPARRVSGNRCCAALGREICAFRRSNPCAPSGPAGPRADQLASRILEALWTSFATLR